MRKTILALAAVCSLLSLQGCAKDPDERYEIWSKDFNPAMRPRGTTLFDPELLKAPFYNSGSERASSAAVADGQ